MKNNFQIEDILKTEGDKKVVALVATGILTTIGAVVAFKNKDKIKGLIKRKNNKLIEG